MENNIGLLFDTPYSVIVRCFASPYACVKYIIYIYIDRLRWTKYIACTRGFTNTGLRNAFFLLKGLATWPRKVSTFLPTAATLCSWVCLGYCPHAVNSS